MKNNLVELVNLFHQYQEENIHTEVSIADFCKHYLASEKMREVEKYKPNHEKSISLEGQIGRAAGRLAKFVDMQMKILATTIEMDTVEEVWYLGSTLDLKNPTKSDMIHYCISEFSSGIGVINRLISKKYLEEYPDELDKRAKRVRLTDKGREKLFSVYPILQELASNVYAILSVDEKEILYQILGKLEKYHQQKYDNSKQK
ncbi:MAG: MarR family transcriptional regulator [Bacteroidetes bacterium]|nr:MAG: MarR family transcriptional regulator [Bacteroidota bacterium]TAG90238.1 MAG: MarR family transcriptional regulator [Bacteroidota bacterium]